MGIRYSTSGVTDNYLHGTDFLRNSQPLSSVKTFLFVLHKAIFQYSVQNSKSLISMLSHNTVHIFTTKAIFGTKM
jgi:hypothetical protein